jgi:NAD-dependent dihydropyrimidine dehydrogenase PreA subunit
VITHIFEDLCTGCDACVTVCPTHVLDPGPTGTPVIARLDQCQTCYMCELYCPADAIYVGADQTAAEIINPEEIRSSGRLGQIRRDYGWTDGAAGDLAEYWRLGPLLMKGGETAAARYALTHPRTPAARGQ